MGRNFAVRERMRDETTVRGDRTTGFGHVHISAEGVASWRNEGQELSRKSFEDR